MKLPFPAKMTESRGPLSKFRCDKSLSMHVESVEVEGVVAILANVFVEAGGERVRKVDEEALLGGRGAMFCGCGEVEW